MKKTLLTLATISFSLAAQAGDLSSNMNSLGGNQEIILRAKELDPNNRVQIVQNRLVNRYNRVEFGMGYSGMAGGDPYVQTGAGSFQMDYHITPRWSLGGRYYLAQNSFTNQGAQRIREASGFNNDPTVQRDLFQLDRPKDMYLAVLNYYPIYGKLNLFNMGVTQFDVYTLIGGGQVNLEKGSAGTYTVGGGLGVWLTQHLSTRFEIRYQGYEDQAGNGGSSRQINWTVFSASIGFIL